MGFLAAAGINPDHATPAEHAAAILAQAHADLPIINGAREIKYAPAKITGVVRELIKKNASQITRPGDTEHETKQRILETKRELTKCFNALGIKIKTPKMTVPQTRTHFMMASPLSAIELEALPYRLDFLAKWRAVKQALEISGAQVTEVSDKEMENSAQIFVRDFYTLIDGCAFFPDPRLYKGAALLNRPAHTCYEKIKQQQANHFTVASKAVHRKCGASSVERTVTEGVFFEGGNIIIDPDRKIIFLGYDIDSNSQRTYSKALSSLLLARLEEGWQSCMVPLTKTGDGDVLKHDALNFIPPYHLDLMMSEPLMHGEIVICPEATTPEAYEQIKSLVGDKNLIEITLEEAEQGATNLLPNGETLIMSSPSPQLKEDIRTRGYTVLTAADFGLKDFKINLGGPHCLANRLPAPRAAMA